MTDTNILVYSLDANEAVKQPIAGALLARLLTSRIAALPAQVLAEFSNVAMRRLRLPPEVVYREVERLARDFQVLDLTSATVLEALRGVREHGFSYYDAQIWAAARLSGAGVVLSEDFNTGATIEGVTFINPFAPDAPPVP